VVRVEPLNPLRESRPADQESRIDGRSTTTPFAGFRVNPRCFVGGIFVTSGMDRNQVSRRRVLGALGAAGVTGLAGCTGNGDGGGDGSDGDGDGGGGGSTPTGAPTETAAEGDGGTATGEPGAAGTVRIGVLQPISEDLQYYGRSSLWGFFSGVAHKAGGEPITDVSSGTRTTTVGDVDYELLIRDTQLSADEAQSLATDPVQNEEVDMLFGCTSSASADRVVKTVSKQVGIPTMIGPAASASITASSETCAENVFRASENTAMDARSGGKYVARNTDVSKGYLFGADYSFGQAVVANYRTVLEQEGVEIVGEKFVPQGYSEWEGLLDNAESGGSSGGTPRNGPPALRNDGGRGVADRLPTFDSEPHEE